MITDLSKGGIKVIRWNGACYREGGTAILNGEVKEIKKLSIHTDQRTPSIFDRVCVLKIETTDGKVYEIEGRGANYRRYVI